MELTKKEKQLIGILRDSNNYLMLAKVTGALMTLDNMNDEKVMEEMYDYLGEKLEKK